MYEFLLFCFYFITERNFFCFRCGMEAEKVTEFISYTQADPVLARQILQSKILGHLSCNHHQ